MASSEQEQTRISLTSLPLDVLLLIVPYLTAQEFLSLSSTCHTFRDDLELRYSATYWSSLTRRTFRVPNQPVVQADGQRWMRLYRRMRTHSKIYAWGNNDGGCFGGTELQEVTAPAIRRVLRGRAPRRMVSVHLRTNHEGWPLECSTAGVGVVSDLQCGGWSLVMLNSKGCLYMNGKLFGLASPSQQHTQGDPIPLSYPHGFVAPSERHDPSTAIEQFSVGRAHVLGLADSGRIWTWNDANAHALQVKFLTIDLRERADGESAGKEGLVTKVVAGWDKSSAYVRGKGIVVWGIVDNDSVILGANEGVDTTLAEDVQIIPDTAFRRTKKRSRDEANELGSRVGEVRNWIVLGHTVVFVTDLGRVFAFPFSAAETAVTTLTEIPFGRGASDTEAVDVQGSHQNFAILLRNGEVLTCDEDKLQHLRTSPSNFELSRVPSLQHTNVISLAFGDYHYHALHANGTITSHGKEAGLRGALGLGGHIINMLRGIAGATDGEFDLDGRLLPECETTGRVVCFEDEKLEWLQGLRGLQGASHSEERARFKAVVDRLDVRAAVSEWAESRLRSWDNLEANALGADDDGLPPYFALSVAAAGWHSGAIVLVNDKKSDRGPLSAHPDITDETGYAATGTSHSLQRPLDAAAQWFLGTPSSRPTPGETLPRLRLPDGQVMPGEGPVEDWVCPEWKSW
ncbi:hypothetical protein FH972_024485 [Carpinus fangiana]|uniref:F-box domain-containing protein n=1 Tax=Carpinus fangiana TaxID=176857 RepID=A0A5N6KYG9_9ROSI|nr:hypothetical protein FH972_024485 [Carpinus fangiana]